jgi:SET domain-containing protein
VRYNIIYDSTLSEVLFNYLFSEIVLFLKQPNCYSKIIQVDGEKHIVIFAQRTIRAGEELTYDYKMPIEKQVENKVLCGCGTATCRGYMN